MAFFDNAVVFSPTFAKHCVSLDRVLALLDAGLRVKKEKCRLLPQRVPFVGHVLSSPLTLGVSTDPEKFSQIKTKPPPLIAMCLSY